MFQNYFRQNINMLHVDKTRELPNTQRRDVSCRRLKTSKHQVIGVGFCRCNFRVKFGNISQPGQSRFISSENLFKESKRGGYIGAILADICRAVGVEVVKNSQLYSDRVCNPCARKIRNLGTLFELIRNTIGSQSAVTQTPPKLAENLSKRLLDTTPGRSPCRKTVRVNSPESVKASRKSLRFDAIPQPFLLCSSRQVTLK